MPMRNPIVGAGGALVREQIRSPNFITGISGWSIQRDGDAEFNNVLIRGDTRTPLPLVNGEFVVSSNEAQVGFFDDNGVFIGGFIPSITVGPDLDTVQVVAQDVLILTDDDIDSSDDAVGHGLRLSSPSDTSGAYAFLLLTDNSPHLLHMGVGSGFLHIERGGLFGNSPVEIDNGQLPMLAGLPHKFGVSNPAVTAGTDTAAVGTYANLAGTGAVTSFSYDKLWDDTNLVVTINASAFSTAVSTVARFGVLVNGTDYDAFDIVMNVANITDSGSGEQIITGLAAGTYTIQGRWRRTVGIGTLTRNSNCWYSLFISEECNV